MATQFPAFLAHASGQNEPYNYEATFLSTDTSVPGDLVFFDTADNNVKKCGANPALILGICLGFAPTAAQVVANTIKAQPYRTNLVPVAVLQEDVIVGLSSATVPTRAFLGRNWDLVNTILTTGAGNLSIWQLLNTQANARVRVIDIDITNGIFYVRFINANLQGLVT